MQLALTIGLSDQDFDAGWRLALASNVIRREDILFYENKGYLLIEQEPNDTLPHAFNYTPRASRSYDNINLYDRSIARNNHFLTGN